MVNLIKLYDITRNPEELFNCLKGFKLVHEKKLCPTCNNQMEFHPNKNGAEDLNGDVVRSISHGLSHHINNVIQDAVFVMKRFLGK